MDGTVFLRTHLRSVHTSSRAMLLSTRRNRSLILRLTIKSSADYIQSSANWLRNCSLPTLVRVFGKRVQVPRCRATVSDEAPVAGPLCKREGRASRTESQARRPA